MELPRYDRNQTYAWNYDHAPSPVEVSEPTVPGEWKFCGLPVASPLGMPAGPLLNGRWCLFYASLGFDVLTYKTVRSRERACYDLPNLEPVICGQLRGGEENLPSTNDMQGSWAVAFGMPSKPPEQWRADVEATRKALPKQKLLSVSVVASIQEGWTEDDLANDYAQCARWAVDSGADAIETNFSCPNVSTCDGQLYQQPDAAARTAARVREAIGGVPYIVKIGHIPHEDEGAALIEALSPHVDALATTNSVATTVVKDGKPLFDGEKRGICGSGILEASLEQTAMLSRGIRKGQHALEIIGVGGVSTADDVKRYLDAGAHAVHVATAAMIHPAVGLELRKGFAAQ